MPPPPHSFTSFSPVPPPPPPPESAQQPDPPDPEEPPLPPAREPILAPTDAPTAVPETTTVPVTVVTSRPPAPPRPSRYWRWARIGAVLGLAAGIGGGAAYHSHLPGEFEAAARVHVTGPAPAGDADTQVSVLRSRAVLDRAAKKLDDLRPFEMPPPKAGPARVAFLSDGLKVAPDPSAPGPGSTLAVAFRGPQPDDTPKYLRAVVEAYKAELASRNPPASSGTPVPPPVPGSPIPAPGPSTSQADAERDRLKKELAALTKDDPSTIEARLAATRSAADEVRVKLRAAERDLALIRAAGPSRRDRLAALEELGVEPVAAEPAGPPAGLRAAEDRLRMLEARKADLGRRLGPEHRDMVALDEQIKAVKEQVAKATPAAPKGPDELDRHREKLEAGRAALAAQLGVLTATAAGDEKLLAEVKAIRTRLDELAAARPPAPGANAPGSPKTGQPAPPPGGAAPPPVPTAYSVQAVLPPGPAGRVSPSAYRTLVPAGLLGLIGGAGLGLLASLVTSSFAPGTRPRRRPPVALTPRQPRIPAPTSTTITAGPRLAVPVFASIPAIHPDLPAERKSVEGLSPMLVSFHRPSSPEAEAFRVARRELTAALDNRGHQVIPVTSPGPGDGKSVVAANLAISLAQSGKRVILVDCDLRRPKVQELFRLTRLGDALKSVMAAEVDLRMAVRSCEVGNLFLLPAGRGPIDPLDLLTRPKFRELLADLRSGYEYVILDAPPTTEEREAALIAGHADGAVLVVRPGPDVRSRADRAQGDLIEAGTRVLGAVVNAAPAPDAIQEQPAAVPPPEPGVPVEAGAKKS